MLYCYFCFQPKCNSPNHTGKSKNIITHLSRWTQMGIHFCFAALSLCNVSSYSYLFSEKKSIPCTGNKKCYALFFFYHRNLHSIRFCANINIRKRYIIPDFNKRCFQHFCISAIYGFWDFIFRCI